MKRLLTLLLILLLITQVPVFADTDNISVVLDGARLSFDQPPVMQNNRVLVPLRAIFEALDASVTWDGSTETVTSSKSGTTVKMQINNTQYTINDEIKTMDVPPLLLNSRTLIPVRAVAESFCCMVDWDNATQTVIIKNKIAVETKTVTIEEIVNNGLGIIKASYPEIINSSNLSGITNINNQIKASVTSDIETLKTYEETDISFEYVLEYGIPNTSNNLIAILYTANTTFGEESQLTQYSEVYKLSNGDKATLTDFFPGKSYEDIIGMIITDFNSVILMEPDSYYENAAELVEIYIDSAVIYPCGNEVAVTFNPGVIAPYEFGFKTLTYPAEL